MPRNVRRPPGEGPRQDGSRRRRAEKEEAKVEGPIARALWSGSITFGLVTVPVELYTASRGRRVSLRMLGPDGAPVAREYVCSAEGEPLDAEEIERGYEVEDGQWVLVSDEELEALSPRRSRDIELTRFVDRDAIDPAWFVRPYFLVPGAEQSKAYRLLAETMERTGRAALAHFVMRGKAYPVAIFAEHGVLRAETLRFGDELRTAADVALPEPTGRDPKRVARMKRAIAALSESRLDERELVDEGARILRERAEEKRRRGEDLVEVPEAAEAPADEEEDGGGEVVDLVALIKRRLAVEKPKRAKPAPPAATRPRRAAGSRR